MIPFDMTITRLETIKGSLKIVTLLLSAPPKIINKTIKIFLYQAVTHPPEGSL